MPRLSIDITAEEHQKLKAIAALKGQSIKEYVLHRTLGDAPSLDGMSVNRHAILTPYRRPKMTPLERTGSWPDAV